MVREEANLLHERGAQLALAREGMEQAGVKQQYGRLWRGGGRGVLQRMWHFPRRDALPGSSW